LAFISGCAQVKPPLGGPEDISPPKAISTIPADSALNVDPATPIEIRFDEYIKAADGGVVISPPVEDFKVKFKYKSIEIKHSALEPNTTYRISVSNALADLRGNNLRRAYGFAFSTGDDMDTLEIGGSIFDDLLLPVSGVRIHAYSADIGLPDPLNSQPRGISWSGRRGNFTLRNLPDGEYLLIAFRDENLDGDISIGEHIGIASDNVLAGNGLYWSIVLFAPDSIEPELLLESVEGPNLLRFKFSEPVILGADFSFSSTPNIGSYKAFLYDGEPHNLGIFTDRQLSAGDISFNLAGISDSAGNSTAFSGTVKIPEQVPDTIRPALKTEKGIRLLPDEPLRIKFDRPVVSGRIVVEDSLGRAVPGETTSPTPFELVFTSHNSWPVRDDLSWQIENMTTTTGAIFSDTVKHDLLLTSANQLGSIVVTSEPPCPFPIIIAIDAGNENSYILEPSPAGYAVEPIPTGRYLLSLFCDADNDSLRDYGSLDPIRLSEPMLVLPDTFVVRAFWTTEVILPVK